MSIVETIVSKTSEVAYTIAFRHIGYLFQYNENIHNLEVETKGLEDRLSGINDMVVSAERNAEVIQPYVREWQNAAKEMQDEVATFLEKKVRSNSWCIPCINCRCPNPMWRYRLGKESKLKTSHVISLKEQGSKFLPDLPLSRPAPPPEDPLTSREAFDSRQEILNGIMEALKDPTINMIGVHGAGGVGKTTMVKEVANLAKKSGFFDDVAFAVVSRNLDKKNVQGELAVKLGLNLDEHGRADKLSIRLQKGKNLVILDDVWDPLNLVDIGIPTTTDHGNKEGCCKVLVTSRKQLLHTKDFCIPILDEEEAWSLFMNTAEISVNFDQETLSAAKKVCDECGGLPVAILAVATALKGKELYAWQDALTLLKNSNFDQIVDIDPNLFSSLKLSYDYLEPRDARSCFLLCSLFPEDAEISIEDLVIYCFGMRLLDRITTLEDVRIRVLTLVKGLKASCLLLEGKDDNTVKMHDVIRDVAILIAKGEKGYLVEHDLKKWPEGGTFEGYSVISLKSEYFSEIPSELGSQGLHTLVLRSKDSSLPDSFFKGMETNLEVLDLSGTAIESLPFSLSKLVKLRMLLLPYKVSDVSLLGELKSLEILRVNGIKKLTAEIRQLTCLKFLDLGKHYNLEVISPNVISNLKRLEELYIPDHFNRWEDEADTDGTNATDTKGRNASLVELNSLTYLTALKVHIPCGKSSPNNLCFENLVRFRISIGAPFKYYGEEEILSTKTLKLHDVPLEDKFKVLLVKSEVVYVTKVKGLENLIHNRDGSGFFNLKHLKVEGEGEDEEIIFPRLRKMTLMDLPNLISFFPSKRPNSITEASNSDHAQPLFHEKVVVPNIQEIKIFDCPNLDSIFSSSTARKLTHLRSLDIWRESSDSKLKAIVETSEERDGANDDELFVFPELSFMQLIGMVNLQSFCSSCGDEESFFNQKVVFPCLRTLWIVGLGNVKGMWNRTPPADSFQNLRHLWLEECHDLLYVGPSELLIGCLRNLENLTIKKCNSLEEVFKSRGSDSGEGIVSRHEPTIEEVDTNVVLPRLIYLHLEQLPRLKSFCSGNKLPSSIGREIYGCPLLETPF